MRHPSSHPQLGVEYHDLRDAGSNLDSPEGIPDTIKWKPILSTLDIMASIEDNNHSHNEYLNQFASGKLNMSRPIGASSSQPLADGGAEPTVPDPKTPPQTPPSRGRSRSPLPRNRQPLVSPPPYSPRMGGEVRKILVRTQDTVEELYIHESHPLSTVKMLIAP